MNNCRNFLFLVFFSIVIPYPLQAAFDSEAAREAFNQGLALKSEGRLDEAERYFKKALEEEPSNADYHFELANIFALQHDNALSSRDPLKRKEMLASAARELEQACMIRPDFTAAHFNLGVVYKKQQKYEAARNEFKKGMELIPPGQPVTPFLMQIASIYEDQGFYDDAESIYKEALEKDYTNSEIRNALETLGERRQSASERASREHASEIQNRMQNFGGGNDRQTSSGNGGLSSLAQQPGVAQLIPSLGSWVVKQMMSRRASAQNTNS